MAAIGDPTTDVRMVTVSIGGNDLLDLLNEPTDLTHIGDPGFNIHPNDLGYAVLAKAHRLVAP